jgi:uncharacterized protein (TIGR03083 family)
MNIALMQETTEEFAAYLSEVTDGDLSAMTPCALWSVEELYRHTVDQNFALGRAVDPELAPPAARGGYVTRELNYRDSARYVAEALSRADGLVDWGEFGKLSPQELFELQLTNTLLHTWDLAKAIGFDIDPPHVDVVEIASDCLRRLPPRLRGQDLRSHRSHQDHRDHRDHRSAPFAPVADFPAGTALEELLVLSGRSPAWPA